MPSPAQRVKLPMCQAHFSALGHWRFYLAPPGLISASELPLGWSLYEAQSRRIVFAGGFRYANCVRPPFAPGRDSEVRLLVSAFHKLETAA